MREAFRTLLKIPKPGPLPRAYPPEEVLRPSEGLFFLKFREGPKSTWNRNACLVCFRYLARVQPEMLQAHGSSLVWEKIVKHAEYLIRKWKLQYKTSEAAVKRYRLLRSAYSRKRTVRGSYSDFERKGLIPRCSCSTGVSRPLIDTPTYSTTNLFTRR